ncbi:MAG TPA: adenylyl-sulfate kinase [Bacteroidia bacterium]|nr:adenylyl-sulfate kinase [Bacteroidia bacterium]HNT80739.1 adenylyl-sulfate kinase [Bacteroidia bacterium]
MNKDIVYQNYKVSSEHRQQLLQQKPLVIWFTGLSGSGKSTLADALEQYLFENGFKTYLLDGDNIRHGLNKNLDFSMEGRQENIRRIGEVSKLFVDAGIIVITAFISPLREDRDQVRAIVPEGSFVEIFVNCPLEECEKRDVKGLYKRARAGQIPNFTGISSPFEEPQSPEIEVKTNQLTVKQSLDRIVEYILPRINYSK